MLKKLLMLTYLKSMRSTILITKSRSEPFCSFLPSVFWVFFFFGLGWIFGRALLQIEEKPRTTVHWDSRSNKHHKEEVHWSLVNLGRWGCCTCSDSPISLPLFIATEYVIFKSDCSTMYFTLQCYLSLLQSSSKADAALNEKNMLQESKTPPWISPMPLPFGRAAYRRKGGDIIRCSFHLARWEILTRSQSCQVGHLKHFGKSWDSLDQTQSKWFLG